jgi:hypothetical protein
LLREAEVALGLSDRSYRGYLTRGLIVGRVRRLLGGGEWDFRRPYLPKEEAERFREDLVRLGVDARWDGPVLVLSDPERRWRPARLEPDRRGLYQVGVFGRAVHPGSGYQRDWEEVAPLPHGAPLDAEAIATALDTGLPLGPGFDRIESEVDVPTLIDALVRSRTDHARERLCVLLAHHAHVGESVEALPLIVAFLDRHDQTLRSGAAYAIATIVERAGGHRVREFAPQLAVALRERLAHERIDEVRRSIEEALEGLGELRREAQDEDAQWFVMETRGALDFLQTEYGFGEPAIVHTGFSTMITYRNEFAAVVASADWRDGVADVLLAKLVGGGLPLDLDRRENALRPSIVANAEERTGEAGMPGPRDREETRRLLQGEARALTRCEDVFRGDFTSFDRAATRNS